MHYPQSVEHHIYRMVQEACENAIRHGQARHIHITGTLDAEYIDLVIEDDGHGFDAEGVKQLETLVAQKHFGLAGMLERAQLIGADVRFDSLPERGTRVAIFWKPAS
jgi:signal transduction histidine kinase